MKNITHVICRFLPLILIAAACVTAQAATETNAVKRPMSVFVDDPRQGKDPFFPDSTRRARVVAQAPTPVSSTKAAQAPETPLHLKGISGTKDLPLAIINSTTIAVGEIADVRSGFSSVKIRCREIRERSVLIENAQTGEIRELKLREGI